MREGVSLYRFFRRANQPWRRIVFYSEGPSYYEYFDGLIEGLLSRSQLSLGYITSAENDPILQGGQERIRAFYFKTLLPLVLLFLDAKVLVMTMTDLHRFHIRRSVRGAHHLYVFHAMVSTHMVYQPGAFDHYDTIFCVGPHHVRELRRAEALYHLPAKRLVEVGYHRLERIYADHQSLLHRPTRRAGRKGLVLVAPSWGASNILETYIREVVTVLVNAGYQVVIRPHPEFMKRRPEVIDALKQEFVSNGHVEMELDRRSDRSIHEADVLVTDWSGIAPEYAFGTERPVLFIDVPLKVRNREYVKWGMEPIELELRSQLGIVLRPEAIGSIDQAVRTLIEQRATYRERIQRCRPHYVYNFCHASEVAVRDLLTFCRDG